MLRTDIFPQTFQSPAVRDIEVIFVAVIVVNVKAELFAITLLISSPTLPEVAVVPEVIPCYCWSIQNGITY